MCPPKKCLKFVDEFQMSIFPHNLGDKFKKKPFPDLLVFLQVLQSEYRF